MTFHARYAPDQPFPSYAHQPGLTPHPRTHPEGHSYDIPEYAGPSASEQAWSECSAYLYGVDLFNHRYYWEAHEAWEGPWKTAPQSSILARFLRGLVQLAAMQIKLRDGNERGANKLRIKALDNLAIPMDSEAYMGLDLAAFCQRIAQKPSAALHLQLAL